MRKGGVRKSARCAAWGAAGATSGLAPVCKNWSTGELAAEVEPLLKGKRDLECGKTWFRENACVAWHLFKNEVRVVCPDLNLGTRKFVVRELVESFTETGKTISNPYGTKQMKIKNGDIFVGRKINEGRDMFQLPDNIFTSSEVRTLKHSDISKSEALPVSLMLSGMVNTCRPDEVADLFAWLQSGAKGAPHRSQTQHAKFTMNRFTLFTPLSPVTSPSRRTTPLQRVFARISAAKT